MSYLDDIAAAIRAKEGSSGVIPANTFATRILALPVGLTVSDTPNPANPATYAEHLEQIANAIRAKEGSSGPIPAAEFAARILALEAQSASRLPDGYTEVEYLSTIPEYGKKLTVRTGLQSKDVSRVILDLNVKDFSEGYRNADQYLFSDGGATSNPASPRTSFSLARQSDKAVYRYGNFFVQNISYTIGSGRIVIDLDRGNCVVSFGGTTFPLNTINQTFEFEFYLLSFDQNAVNALPCDMYSCKIYNGNSMIRDFVPCKTSSEAVGLFDLVDGLFYEATGNLTAGPPV